MNSETALAIANVVAYIAGMAVIIGIPVLFGWLIYRAIIGIIREVKKKD